MSVAWLKSNFGTNSSHQQRFALLNEFSRFYRQPLLVAMPKNRFQEELEESRATHRQQRAESAARNMEMEAKNQGQLRTIGRQGPPVAAGQELGARESPSSLQTKRCGPGLVRTSWRRCSTPRAARRGDWAQNRIRIQPIPGRGYP